MSRSRDSHHTWSKSFLDSVEPLLFTCEAVLTEACHLLRKESGGVEAVLTLVARDILRCSFRAAREAEALDALLKRFASVPMSLADACLVRMAELVPDSAIVTLDRDFHVYRRHRRQVIPVISPR